MRKKVVASVNGVVVGEFPVEIGAFEPGDDEGAVQSIIKRARIALKPDEMAEATFAVEEY